MSKTDEVNKHAELMSCLIPFLEEIKDMTANQEVEHWLNEKYGTRSEFYQRLSGLIIQAVQEGWAADIEVAGPQYRRSRLITPCEDTFFFSVTAILMDSTDNDRSSPGASFRGGYHAHPYGEFNLVVPLNAGAVLAGPRGWCSGGWTVLDAGSGHYPEVRGGAVISLTILPAGRISFSADSAPD